MIARLCAYLYDHLFGDGQAYYSPLHYSIAEWLKAHFNRSCGCPLCTEARRVSDNAREK